MYANCDEVARQLKLLADEFLAGKLTQAEFWQDLDQLHGEVERWVNETPNAYA